MISTKEKAKQFLDKFMFASIYFTNKENGSKKNAKQCALIAIREIKQICPYISKDNCDTVEQLRASDASFVSYWDEVEKELLLIEN